MVIGRLLLCFDGADLHFCAFHKGKFRVAFCDGDGFVDVFCDDVVVTDQYLVAFVVGTFPEGAGDAGDHFTFADEGLCAFQEALFLEVFDVDLTGIEESLLLQVGQIGFAVAFVADDQHELFHIDGIYSEG